MKTPFIKSITFVMSIFISCTISVPALADPGQAGFKTRDGTPREIGDALQYVLPLSALGATFLQRDLEGTYQYTWAGISTALSIGLGKLTYEKLRPTGLSRTSFPSGHTGAAFSGASFIYARYGHKWGWLAYGLAGYTGYSRVWADAHFLNDVVAGASVGTLWSLFYTSPYASDGGVMVLPSQMGEDGVGVMVTFREKIPTGVSAGEEQDNEINWFRPPSRAVRNANPRHTFTFGFGPAFLDKQQIKSPSSGGTAFDLFNFNRDDDPTPTAGISLELDLKGKHSLLLAFHPFESRDTGRFSNPVAFAGQTFPANTNIRSAWLMYDFRAAWNYDIYDDNNWNIDAGIGAAVQYLDILLQTFEGPAIESSVNDTSVLPLAHVDMTYNFTPKWSIYADIEGSYLGSTDWIFDVITALRYEFNPQWGASVGYNHYSRDIETDELANRTEYNSVFLAVDYSF